MSSSIRLMGDLPSGLSFDAVVSHDIIAVRAGDQICVAHPRWMTAEVASRTAEALRALAGVSS